MRVRTARTLAQRIDLYYFKRARGMQRWRYVASAAVPLAALIWVSGLASAGTRTPYSPGPVSTAHAYTETRCEACHAGSTRTAGFRAHTTDTTCLACHDAPAHAPNQTPPPSCAACHQEHRGRVRIAATADAFCVDCHRALETTGGPPAVSRDVGAFPANHPEFAAARPGAQDPGRIRFNHAVHMKADLRGPAGPETLACDTCHKPEAGGAGRRARGPDTTGLMTPIAYQPDCARCHPLFFDERLDQAVPHAKPDIVRAFVRQTLTAYIRANPGDIARPDAAFRRVPLNFPREPEPPARNADEWIARRAAAGERLLWNKTCAECHETASLATAPSLPEYALSHIARQWMPHAAFDHTPHATITCASCHAAATSSKTSDVLMPSQAACATCHTASSGAQPASGRAESRCFECHRYHDWTKARPVTPGRSLTDRK